MTDSTDQSAASLEFSIDHTAISVSNLDVSMRFYTDILGFTCERIIDIPDGNGRIALLTKADFTIEMFEFVESLPLPEKNGMLTDDLKKVGVKHVALRVKDIWTAAAYLKERGVEFINEPVKGARGYYRFFIKDPDGMPVELTEGPGYSLTAVII
ncbi:MAG: VOC family protein [Dehalococcoidales bacterium]|nr:MAG: VOC family protein [Dehalococcoidales bacterium]